MGKAKGERPGDTVIAAGYTRKGKVVKTKPDGTKLVRTKVGTLKEMKNPDKPVDRDTEH